MLAVAFTTTATWTDVESIIHAPAIGKKVRVFLVVLYIPEGHFPLFYFPDKHLNAFLAAVYIIKPDRVSERVRAEKESGGPTILVAMYS